MPFTHDEFLDVFAAYNRALWPAALALWLLTAATLVALHRRRPGAPRIAAAVLALHRAWAGVAHHWAFFRDINPAATAFGVAFVVQAVLLAWRGVMRTSLAIRPPPPTWSRIGAAFVGWAMLHPALGLAFGLAYPRLPTFGVPCPTTLLTLGLLLMAPRREARLLGVIPVPWAMVGGSAAMLFGVTADYALPVAGGCLVILAATREPAPPAASF